MTRKRVVISDELALSRAIIKLKNKFLKNENKFKDKLLLFLTKAGFENASFDCKREDSLMFYLDRNKRFNFFGLMICQKEIVFHEPFDDDPPGGGPVGSPQTIQSWKNYRQFTKEFKVTFDKRNSKK